VVGNVKQPKQADKVVQSAPQAVTPSVTTPTPDGTPVDDQIPF